MSTKTAPVKKSPSRKSPLKTAKVTVGEILEGVKERKPRAKKRANTTNVVDSNGYITLNDYFKVPEGVYKILQNNIVHKRNTMLLGPTGVGKTELVHNIASKMGLPLTIFDMGTMTDPIMSLVGTHAIKVRDGHTTSEFIRSRFSEVITSPGVVLLDELSRSPATANNLLFPVLDFRKSLSMEYCFDNAEPVKVHKDCVFIATANLGSQYTGTHKLDRALIDRFTLMEIDPLTTVQITETLTYCCPKLNATDIKTIVNCYQGINKAHDEFIIGFNLSLRHLKVVGELVTEGFSIYDGFYTICKGIGGKEGLKALESILNLTKK